MEVTRVAPKKKSNPATRTWCWTLNNYTEKKAMDCWEWMEDNCSYAIMAFEYSDNGTPHLQGYFRAIHSQNPLRYIHCGGLIPTIMSVSGLGACCANNLGHNGSC